jgi:hypothetical protein
MTRTTMRGYLFEWQRIVLSRFGTLDLFEVEGRLRDTPASEHCIQWTISASYNEILQLSIQSYGIRTFMTD